jgi:hypothetical protein
MVSQRCSGGYDLGSADETGVGDGHQGGEDEELERSSIQFLRLVMFESERPIEPSVMRFLFKPDSCFDRFLL